MRTIVIKLSWICPQTHQTCKKIEISVFMNALLDFTSRCRSRGLERFRMKQYYNLLTFLQNVQTLTSAPSPVDTAKKEDVVNCTCWIAVRMPKLFQHTGTEKDEGVSSSFECLILVPKTLR